ncbi:hypothetical protein L207DRAFT_638743 [Hyaloscypha variabilis F]|jgi:hypothetical protein|uniref:Uncharacterized protein n=1 Tax=Hyaloscypha variabilis (strain UAMH 11265 / GT02V1 / F) TaxID=1149755 RepID=A0A2J6R6Q9_HYAVF|nr:hypothetical protein L207DRAFT_638743 [Hyaloscypha variabilis F]
MPFFTGAKPQYSHVETPQVASIELIPTPLDGNAFKVRPIGKPKSKPTLDILDLCTVLGSFACLAASICVVTPHLTLSWKLGFNGQIIAIGFLLSIMNLALKTLQPRLFLIIEYRWGNSRLQNYDAILRNAISLSKTGVVWRLTLFFFTFLPLALSIGYKRFTGGHSSATINPDIPSPLRRYGIAPPPLGDYNAMNNSVYYMINSNVPFMTASASDAIQPPTQATAYGYNTLLLDTQSAALLDLPLPDYMSSIQARLKGNDTWTISATVNATVTRYNTSIDSFRDNQTYWQENFGGSYVTAFEDFTGYLAIGYLPGVTTADDGNSCFLCHFLAADIYWVGSVNISSSDGISFKSAARMFNTRRERCSGVWSINSTAVSLIGGSCNGTRTDQNILQYQTPFPIDTLSVLVHSLFSYAEERSNSSWLVPAFTTAVASAYWARFAYMLPGIMETAWVPSSEYNYLATDELIIATTATLDASWLLYLLLAMQPVFTALMFILAAIFYTSPIGKGFGMTAVLSGVNKNSLGLLSGAALSGELERPVKLDISVANDIRSNENTTQVGRIQYSIDGVSAEGEGLIKGEVYS